MSQLTKDIKKQQKQYAAKQAVVKQKERRKQLYQEKQWYTCRALLGNQ